MKINRRKYGLKLADSTVKMTNFKVGKMTAAMRYEMNGRGNLSALHIRDDTKDDDDPEERQKKDHKSLPEFDQSVCQFLKRGEQRKYQRLPKRIRRRLMTEGSRTYVRGPAIRSGSTMSGGTGSGSVGTAAGNAATSSLTLPASASQTLTASSGAASTAAASASASSAAAATTSVAASTAATTTTVTTVTTTAVTTTTAAATAAATGAATAGATAGAFVVIEGAKAAKKASEKIKKSLKDSVKIKKTKEAAMQEADQKTSSGKKKLPGAGGALQEFAESFKKITGMAAGAMVSSILSLAISLIALPIVLLIAIVAVIVLTIFGNTSTGNGQIVEIAKIEAAAEEENIGGFKYKEWYGSNCDWCAVFVSWCADQCGYIDGGLFPKSASVSVYRDFFDSQGNFHMKGDYEPKAGDLIIYGETGSSHIGIVAEYNSTAGIITTIEGNTGPSATDTYHEGSRVREKQVSIVYSWIYGFCSPDYPVEVDTLTGGTNIEQAFNYFVALGYTQEASAGIVGNLLRESGFTSDGDLAINVTAYDGAVGIAMWTYPSIRDGFLNYAKARGEPWPDTGLKVQLDYLAMTIDQPEQWMFNHYAQAHYPASANISLSEFKRCTDISVAATAFCACYERPYYSLSALNDRIEYAQTVYRRYARKTIAGTAI